MEAEVWGTGTRVVLVHGAITNGTASWSKQRPLGDTTSFPKLVVSGGHSPMQERMCDVLASAIGARRGTIPGAGHNVQRASGCNDVLSHFWHESEAREAG